jgi:hypothetical protein
MIEDFSKYKFFYVNGSSHTIGGGLETSKIRSKNSVKSYNEKYGVIWDDNYCVNWPYRLSEIIKIPVINEATSGAGPDRSIRMTYDFINKHWKDRDKFFIILENPDSSRCDVFYKKLNSYFIVNTQTTTDKLEYATREYFNKKIDDSMHQSDFNDWVNRHFKLEEKINQDEKSLIGLYSFCKLHNIKIYLMRNNWSIFTDIICDSDIINFDKSKKDNFDSIFEWCERNKLLIIDEVGIYDNFYDKHPGYFGHIEYAKKLAKFLGWSSEYPKYPIYKKAIL